MGRREGKAPQIKNVTKLEKLARGMMRKEIVGGTCTARIQTRPGLVSPQFCLGEIGISPCTEGGEKSPEVLTGLWNSSSHFFQTSSVSELCSLCNTMLILGYFGPSFLHNFCCQVT